MIIASFPKGSFPENSWPVGTWPVAPEWADIQYTEVMDFAVCIATSAGFSVVLPNDASVVTTAYPDIIVSGAGVSAANGTYVYAGDAYGKPYYSKGSDAIIWLDAMGFKLWNLGGLYQSVDDVATPDLVTTWTVNAGSLPLPAVTSTAPISGVSVTAAFTVEMPMIIDFELYEELSA